jgi:multiple sugar transport system permease protein
MTDTSHPWYRGRHARRRYHRDEIATAAICLAPAVAILGSFVVYPIISAGYLSLTEWSGFGTVQEFVGLENYRRLAGDPDVGNSLLVTAIYGAGVTVLSCISGLGLALLLDGPIRGRTFYRTIYFFPVVTSAIAVAVLWRDLLDPAGFVGSVLDRIGIENPNWLGDRWLALTALTLVTAWKNLGFNAVLYLTALQAIPSSLYEAARLDGGSAWQLLRRITVPLLAPMTFLVSVQALITSFQSFDLVYVLTNGGPLGGTDVLGMLTYRTSFRLGEFGYGASIAFVTCALVLGVTLVQWRLSGSGKSALQ